MIKARMRTMTEVMKHVRENDPDGALTPWAVRNMIKNGRIPSVKQGRKYLVNIDLLDEYLRLDAEKSSTEDMEAEGYGEMRRLDFKLLG